MAERDPKRADLTTFERRRQHTRAAGGVIALLQERQHPLAKLRELRCRPFAPKKIASQFRLKLLDRSRQRGLGDVAFVRGTGEVQQPRNSEEIPDLMHFHDRAALSGSAQTTRMATVRTPEPR